MVSLSIIVSGTKRTLEQGSYLKIGRESTQCDLVLEDRKVSRLHATIEYNTPKEIYVIDHESTNGTYYNDVKIRNKQQINVPKKEPGILQLGPVRLELQLQGDIPKTKKDTHRGDTELEIDI